MRARRGQVGNVVFSASIMGRTLGVFFLFGTRHFGTGMIPYLFISFHVVAYSHSGVYP
jgi:hypothetical protein